MSGQNGYGSYGYGSSGNGSSGYGSYGNGNSGNGPSVSSVSFGINEYGYGSAAGELTGPISNGSGSPGTYYLEVDLWNDGTVDYTDQTANDVSSIWAELTLPYTQNLPNQTMPVAVRVGETRFDTGASTTGNWYVGNISVLPPANTAPVVSALTYTPWDQGYGLFGYLSGNIDDLTPAFGAYELQIDSNNDGYAEFSLQDSDTSAERTAFLHEYNPTVGPQTVRVRVRETDVNTGQVLNGAWESLTFTPSLPANEAPEIDYLVFSDSGYGGYGGYGSYGNADAEFRDYTREGSSYEVEVDREGDGDIDFSGYLQSDYEFSASGIESGGRVRIRETDNFGRVLHSAWVGMTAFGQQNTRPSYDGAPREAVVSRFALTAGQSVGTWTATDADGDTLRYKIEISPRGNQFSRRGVQPGPSLTINAGTGQVLIGNVDAVKLSLERDLYISFSVKASDGKGTVGRSVELVDDYEPYFAHIESHIHAWATYASGVATDTAAHTLAAVGNLKDFAEAEGQEWLGMTALAANLTWVAAATLETGPGVIVAAAAVVAQHLYAQAYSENQGATIAQILLAYQTKSDALLTADRASIVQTELNEGNAIGTLRVTINAMTATGVLGGPSLALKRLRAVKKYLSDLQVRLRIKDPAPVPTTAAVYGRLLISYAQQTGRSFWGSSWHSEFGANYWYLGGGNGQSIVTELNRIGYRYPADTVHVTPTAITVIR